MLKLVRTAFIAGTALLLTLNATSGIAPDAVAASASGLNAVTSPAFSPCDGLVRPTAATSDSEHSFCSLADLQVGDLHVGEAAVIKGRVEVDDQGRRLNLSQRAFLNVQLRCFDSAHPERALFATNAVRNVYTGIPRTQVTPQGVLVASEAGHYSCVLDARQYNVASGTQSRTWLLRSPRLTAEVADHGISTDGPNQGKWPSTRTDITAEDSAITTGQLDVEPGRGVRSVSVDASIPLSTCAYHSPDTNACWPPDSSAPLLNPNQPLVGDAELTAEQRTNRGEECGAPLSVTKRVVVTSITHHLTANLTGALRLDDQCRGVISIRVKFSVVAGRGYIGTAGPTRNEAGRAFQQEVGATWD